MRCSDDLRIFVRTGGTAGNDNGFYPFNKNCELPRALAFRPPLRAEPLAADSLWEYFAELKGGVAEGDFITVSAATVGLGCDSVCCDSDGRPLLRTGRD